MNDEELKAGIAQRQALIAFAKTQGGEMTPGEAEYYEAGWAAGVRSVTSAWCDQPFAIVRHRPHDGAPADLAYFDGVSYMFADGDCFDRDGDTLDGYTAEFLTLHQLERRLFSGQAPHNGDATIVASVLATGYEGGFLGTSPDDQGVTLQLRYTSPATAEAAFDELARVIDAALAAAAPDGVATITAGIDVAENRIEVAVTEWPDGAANNDADAAAAWRAVVADAIPAYEAIFREKVTDLAMRHIDRMNDICPEDPAERIVESFSAQFESIFETYMAAKFPGRASGSAIAAPATAGAEFAELLPCPFCGGQAHHQNWKGNENAVWCDTCSVGTAWTSTRAKCNADWNRRASPAPIGNGLTERKTAEIMARGYRQVGYVLQSDAGDYCLSTRGGVRWLSAEHHRKLMGGSNEVLLACLDDLRTAQARIAELEAKAPQRGWRLMPTKPTEDQWSAGIDAWNRAHGTPAGEDGLPNTIYAAMLAAAPAPPACWCSTCAQEAGQQFVTHMVLCPTCGNKRCPKANDHRNACTGSNEPGQPGSAYPAWTPEGKEGA